MNWFKDQKEKMIDQRDERQFKKNEKAVIKYGSYQNQYTLCPGKEEEWYHMTLERVKEMEDKSTVEILQELKPNVQYHNEVKKRMKKQIKKLAKKPYTKTIKDCLREIMKDYLLEGGTRQATAREKHRGNNEAVDNRRELIKQPKNDTEKVSNEHNLAMKQKGLKTFDEERRLNHEVPKLGTMIPESLNKIKKKIRKRCHCCRRRGHLIKDWPINKKRRKQRKNVERGAREHTRSCKSGGETLTMGREHTGAIQEWRMNVDNGLRTH